MQETIKQIMEVENKAAKIIAEAEMRANNILDKNNAEISEKLNKYRSEEHKRFDNAVIKAEERKTAAVNNIKTSDNALNLNLDIVSDEVLKRVLRTVFDQEL